ncbi:MAG: DUF4011 domain-containing protein, partial [Propionibacteriaceae bacterium]|nr:DUF4011 domain-containing protein [Propionibacteriaceae bacterium]
MSQIHEDPVQAEVANALEHWKKDLLQVSLRSPLLNYRETKSHTVVVTSPDITEIERGLRSGAEFSFLPLPDGAEEPPQTAVLNGVRKTKELQTAHSEPDLGRKLRTLARRADAEYQERGINVCYMAVGMLKWRGIDNTDLASPLVLVPVTLASSGSK